MCQKEFVSEPKASDISNALAIACTGHLLMEKEKLKYTIEKSRQIDIEIEKKVTRNTPK